MASCTEMAQWQVSHAELAFYNVKVDVLYNVYNILRSNVLLRL